MRSSLSRFILASFLLVSTTLLLRARGSNEVFPARLPLQSFPTEINGLHGTDVPIDKDALEKLGPGDFLVRVYTDERETAPYIDLYMAYFPSQKTGDTIHSPKNCLPGSGWSPLESKRMMISVPGHTPFSVNRYLIAKAGAKQLVLYWYWAHDRGIASEYWAKYYLVADSLKMNRSDGALVRVTTPILAGESPEVAEQRLLPFVHTIVPMLQNYIPR
ncbi:MAG TPA: EpsI family protein [Dongiaceae bacterium]|nr:EpsI family protein [Dongiaceae bacterium]